MKKCKCGSHAINPHHHGRDDTDMDLCDVCYWRKRANSLQQFLEEAQNTSTNTGSMQFTAKQLHRAARDAGLHSADIIDLIEVIGKQQAGA